MGRVCLLKVGGILLSVGLLTGLSAAQPTASLPETLVLWTSGANVAGTLLLDCVAGRGVCETGSFAQRVNASGKYAVVTWNPVAIQPDLKLAWRDVNGNAQIDAGDDLVRLSETDQRLRWGSVVRLKTYDGNWRAFLGNKVLDNLYDSDTGGSIPPQGPLPLLARLPLKSGPTQPSIQGARGSFSGSWALWSAFPAPLPKGRAMDTPPAIRDSAWPLQMLGFQDRFQGRYLYTVALPGTAAAKCQRGSEQTLKLEGQFATAGGTLTMRDTAKTLTTTCVQISASTPAGSAAPSEQDRALCNMAAAQVPADQRAAILSACLSALAGGGPRDNTTQTKQALGTQNHTYQYRRYDLHLNNDERDGLNYLLFLEDAQGQVYLYVKL